MKESIENMLFGDKSLFSIEYELSEEPHGVWMIGYIHYYINNQRIGDVGFTTSLRDVMIQLQCLCERPEKRIYKKLFQKEYGDIFSIIENAFQEEICSGKDGVFGDIYGYYPGEFILLPQVDVLDDWPTYMVSSGGADKVICIHTESGLSYYGTFERGVIDKVMRDTLMSLEEKHEELSSLSVA